MSSFKCLPFSFSVLITKSSKTKTLIPISISPSLSINRRKTLTLTLTLTLTPFSISPNSMASSWTCSKCTFINTNPHNPICQICSSSHSPPPISSSSSSSSIQEKWACKACTFLNPYISSNCEICGTRNSSLSSVLSLADDELEPRSSGVGDVFLPLLQRCNGTKRKVRDDPVEVDDGSFDFGGSRGVKSANKEVVNADETVAKSDPKTLKILSYNVWFAEDLELRTRMKAIGDIIQLHSPDIICLQEVTPDIYAIFQRSNWWKSYKCSLSFDMAITRPYYCMQLSKLPVKSFRCEPFSFSAMGRELCVAEVSVSGGGSGGAASLVVATSHLESPCPGPPKWDQMYSKERVQQAHEAVGLLRRHPNAVFCGDMNWDDKLDGPFPLPDGWADVWTERRPAEAGWTYDTKSNGMLAANRRLQKRLDRVLVGLRDFRVDGIEMVGTEAVVGATYVKQKKGGKEVELPVFPSDHFGLLLTVSAR